MMFIISGSTPSKKNSKQIIYVRGKPMIVSSDNYQVWHRDAVTQVSQQIIKKRLSNHLPLKKVEKISVTFFAKDKRKFDLSNKIESVNDLLVDVGVLEDDNYEVLPSLEVTYGGIDKVNPRAEIDIK